MVVTHTVGWWQTHGFGAAMVVGGVVEFTIVVWRWSKFVTLSGEQLGKPCGGDG